MGSELAFVSPTDPWPDNYAKYIILLSIDPTHHLEESKAMIQTDNSDRRKLQERKYQCIDRFDPSGQYATVFIIVTGKLIVASVNARNALARLVWRLRATLARSALTRVSLARFTSATSILTRFQFGTFLFGALPLRRVSLWRASTSARFSLAHFPIWYLSWCIIGYLIICFLSARVFCEEVLSTPVLREATLLGLLSRITFCVLLLYKCVIYLLIISTRQRWLHHSELVYLRCFLVFGPWFY